jgi:hypothetical protein
MWSLLEVKICAVAILAARINKSAGFECTLNYISCMLAVFAMLFTLG